MRARRIGIAILASLGAAEVTVIDHSPCTGAVCGFGGNP